MIDTLCNFLFSQTDKKPQIGFAGKDKKAWLWLPGKTEYPTEEISKKMQAPIKGCTQLAFDSYFSNSEDQNCEVCWFGLDIDKDDNEEIDLLVWAIKFAQKNKAAMVRYSCSGEGIHLMWKLENPIPCTNQSAGYIVTSIAKPYKLAAEAEGIHVCQANRRMFWLTGGKNKTIYTSTEMLDINMNTAGFTKQREVQQKIQVTDKVQKYIDILKDAGVLHGDIKASNQIYVGDAVKALRDAGEKVYTKSSCSGNGQVNGYIDILGHRISLWAYADNHTIWSYDDVEEMLS